ncbi:MAG: biotin--[acetyl-CoA-carboxylase] ligase [Alphaproteobacteria bacterium]|nr:biotin--[acetyl-CoA-carboxylase] ligase [Alphaproteobacteria bacterium]
MSFIPRIVFHPSLPSTMDEAQRLAEAGAPEGTVVQAGIQTAGRGRFGNTWTSPEGNLYTTTLFRPQVATRFCAQMSFVCAVALSDTLVTCGVPKAAIGLKWPNDVLVDGKKIAGILLEMRSGQGDTPDYLTAGIGVNVAVAPEGGTAISQYSDAPLDEVRDALLGHLGALYGVWLTQGFMPIRTRWLEQAYGVGKPVTARMAERKVEGVFEAIDHDGNLILKEPAGNSRTISSGAVHFRVS